MLSRRAGSNATATPVVAHTNVPAPCKKSRRVTFAINAYTALRDNHQLERRMFSRWASLCRLFAPKNGRNVSVALARLLRLSRARLERSSDGGYSYLAIEF